MSLVLVCTISSITTKMTNLFKRNKTYYIRLSINDNLKIFFNNKTTYIRSLKTNNVNNARIVCRYLVAQFNYIKRSTMTLTLQQIQKEIEKFKKINYDDIINRNTYLSIEEIDKNIKILSSDDLDINTPLLKNEFYNLLEILHNTYNIDNSYELNQTTLEELKRYIAQIKINALSSIKKDIQSKIIYTNNDTTKTITPTQTEDIVTIKEAVEEFLQARQGAGLSQNVITSSTKDVNKFLDYCNLQNLTNIKLLKNKDLIAYRVYLKKQNPNVKIRTLNIALTNMITFLNYCTEIAHYIPYKITKNIKFTMTIKDKRDTKREPYTNEDIKKILDNIDLIKYSQKTNKPRKYANEYELIIKIAMYTGARENEICQLTKNDIKVDNGIYYFHINIDEDKHTKNLSSIRKVPIHSTILNEVKNYISKLKRDNLFTITSKQFSIDYSAFKTKLKFTNKKVFHSFRNTMQNKLKQLQVQGMIINELTGHGANDEDKMTDTYTSKYDLKILKDNLEKISYECDIIIDIKNQGL